MPVVRRPFHAPQKPLGERLRRWLAGARQLVLWTAASLAVPPTVAAGTERARMPDRLIPDVIRVLESDSAPERVRAAMEFARLQKPDPAALDSLHAHLEDDAPAVRSACLYALGKVAHKPTLPWIIDALNDPAPEVRIAACEALGAAKMGGYTRMPFEDQDPTVRLAAIQVIQTVDLTAPLLKQLKTRLELEEQADVRAQILRGHREHGMLPSQAMLQTILSKGEAVERLEALRCLATADAGTVGEEVVNAALYRFNTGPAPVRAATVDAVRALSPPGSVQWLRTQSADPDHGVRKAVAHALGAFSEAPQARQALTALQRDANAEVRRMASMSLVQHAEAGVANLDRHAAALCRGDRAVLRREGLWMLGRLRSQAGFPDILELARRDFPPPSDEEAEFDPGDLRETRLVIWVIQRSRYEPALPQTIPWFLQKWDAATQFHAARAIGENRYEAAVPALAKAILETRTEAGIRYFFYAGIGRDAGVEALATIANEQALDALEKVMGMTRPMDSPANLAVMARALAANGRSEKAVRNLKRAMHELGRLSPDSPIAHAYRDMTGRDIPGNYAAGRETAYDSDLITPR